MRFDNKTSWFIDWKFWLLFYIINISGNLGFTIIFDDKILTSIAFLFVIIMSLFTKCHPLKQSGAYICAYILLMGIPMIYLGNAFSWSSYIHISMKFVTGALTILLLKTKFIDYYIKIMAFFAVISLICFSLNCVGIIIPFISIESTSLDGGNIYRVSSLIYTQLYNDYIGLTLRNCGPFWEPGAFQGFLNLAIAILVFGYNSLNKNQIWLLLLFTITVITTYSTGGYIVLGILLILFILRNEKLSPTFKLIALISGIMICTYCYVNLDFLSDKISNDEGRLGFSIDDFANDNTFWFGYSYSADALMESKIATASSIINLLKYTGVIGFLFFICKLSIVKYSIYWNLAWCFVIILILMNEPFLTAGPFWWSCLYLWDFIQINRMQIHSMRKPLSKQTNRCV